MRCECGGRDKSGEQSQCGWCKDVWWISWQITPNAMMDKKKIDISGNEAAARED
jgi:predicted 3-demethylubiquinone-9 3-methyltransferase (glyoxalase superfamily)